MFDTEHGNESSNNSRNSSSSNCGGLCRGCHECWNSPSCTDESCCEVSTRAWVVISISTIAVVMICSMVPSSYYGVEYNQYALSRYKLTNKMDYDHVYDNGFYYLGLNYEMITFPRAFQYEEFDSNDLRVFSKEGLEFPFQCSFQWRPLKSAIPNIHRQFRVSYRPQVINRVIATIKNTVTQFTTDDFVTKRAEIDFTITKAIGDAVDDLGFEIPADKFQFAKPLLPDNVRSRFLQTQIQLVKNDEQVLRQQQALVLQETGVLVNQILSNSTRVLNEANSTSTRILNQAKADAFRLIGNAEQSGLNSLFVVLNITDLPTKSLLLKFINIEDNPDTKLYVGSSASQVFTI